MTSEKVAVVTGAGSGLGRLITITLADKGWYVAAAGRRIAPLEETMNLARPEMVLPVATDVGDAESVATLFATVGERFGRVDLLVNNAGTGTPPGAVDEVTPEGWQSIVATNLTGSYLCAHHAVRMMKAQDPQGGRIINNGSISAHAPRPGSVGYTVTKHAITGLTKSISLDGRPFNIACGQIDIGNANTEMTQWIAAGAPQADGSIMAEPTFDPKHAADAVAFMAELPLAANVQFMTITATTMPFIGRGLPVAEGKDPRRAKRTLEDPGGIPEKTHSGGVPREDPTVWRGAGRTREQRYRRGRG